MYPSHSLAPHLSSVLEEYLSDDCGDGLDEPPELVPMQDGPQMPEMPQMLRMSPMAETSQMQQMPHMQQMQQMPHMQHVQQVGRMTAMTSDADVPSLPDLPDLLGPDDDPDFDFLLSPASVRQPEALHAEGPRSVAGDGLPSPRAPGTPLQGLSGLLLDAPPGPGFRLPQHRAERPHPYQRPGATPSLYGSPNTPQTPRTPQTPDTISTPASPAPHTITLPSSSPYSPCSPYSPSSLGSRGSRTGSEDTSRTSRRTSRSESLSARSTPSTWASLESACVSAGAGASASASASAGARAGLGAGSGVGSRAGLRTVSGPATVAAAVAMEALKKQTARLEAVSRLTLDRPWPAEPAADFFQSAVLLSGWPEDLAIQYLDFTVAPPLRRILRPVTEPPGTTGSTVPAGTTGTLGAPLPVSITRHADGHLDAGLDTTPTDLRPNIAATPLGHLDAMACGLRWIHYGPYERALSALMANFRMPLSDLKREIDAQGQPSGSYALALQAMAVTVRSQTAIHQLQLAVEQGRLAALTGEASRPSPSGQPVDLPEVIKIE